jgi:hypothetical protein
MEAYGEVWGVKPAFFHKILSFVEGYGRWRRGIWWARQGSNL